MQADTLERLLSVRLRTATCSAAVTDMIRSVSSARTISPLA
jgi:hypothetical protein